MHVVQNSLIDSAQMQIHEKKSHVLDKWFDQVLEITMISAARFKMTRSLRLLHAISK